MRVFEKSLKLNNVCYDIRGPVMDEANRMQAAGEQVLKLIFSLSETSLQKRSPSLLRHSQE